MQPKLKYYSEEITHQCRRGGAAQVMEGRTNVRPHPPETPPPANAPAASLGAAHATPVRHMEGAVHPRRIGTPAGATALETPQYIEFMSTVPRTENRAYHHDPPPMHPFFAELNLPQEHWPNKSNQLVDIRSSLERNMMA
ncbi:unnamed protein product, partial [Meganyctiphanes norvegica]